MKISSKEDNMRLLFLTAEVKLLISLPLVGMNFSVLFLFWLPEVLFKKN